jgi:hypothetical protein
VAFTSVPAGKFLNTFFNNCCTRSLLDCVELVELEEDESLVDVVEVLLFNEDSKEERSVFGELLVPPGPLGGEPPQDCVPLVAPLGGEPNSLCSLDVSMPLAVRT